jgi:hypothetical protein
MSRHALALAPVVLTFLAGSLVFGCEGLKRADEAADAGSVEAGDDLPPTDEDGGAISTKDGSVADGATADAGAPPLDFTCDDDPWVKTTKTKAECAPRQVRVVDAISPVDVREVSIARTPTGRVGIVYNRAVDADTGARRHRRRFRCAPAHRIRVRQGRQSEVRHALRSLSRSCRSVWLRGRSGSRRGP